MGLNINICKGEEYSQLTAYKGQFDTLQALKLKYQSGRGGWFALCLDLKGFAYWDMETKMWEPTNLVDVNGNPIALTALFNNPTFTGTSNFTGKVFVPHPNGTNKNNQPVTYAIFNQRIPLPDASDSGKVLVAGDEEASWQSVNFGGSVNPGTPAASIVVQMAGKDWVTEINKLSIYGNYQIIDNDNSTGRPSLLPNPNGQLYDQSVYNCMLIGAGDKNLLVMYLLGTNECYTWILVDNIIKKVGINVTTAATPPNNPDLNDIWIDTNSFISYTWTGFEFVEL